MYTIGFFRRPNLQNKRTRISSGDVLITNFQMMPKCELLFFQYLESVGVKPSVFSECEMKKSGVKEICHSGEWHFFCLLAYLRS